MSRIGKKPIAIPAGIQVNVAGQTVTMKGPKGQLQWTTSAVMDVAMENQQIVVRRHDDEKTSRQLHGTTRAILANMIKGVQSGYEKRLLIYGTGYGCSIQNKRLQVNVGFSGLSINKGPQFSIPIPEGVEVVVEAPAARGDNEPAKLLIRGIDKQKVGEFASEIRALRKPEPYKGKGIRYEGEHVKRKQGKAFTTGG